MFNVPKRIIFDRLDEELTGFIGEKKASDIEERWSRAVEKIPEWSYQFQARISPIFHTVGVRKLNLPGEVEIDFLMKRGKTLLPVMIDGEIAHFYTAWQKSVDDDKTAIINNALRALNAQPVIRLPANKYDLWRLATQEAADQYAREILT